MAEGVEAPLGGEPLAGGGAMSIRLRLTLLFSVVLALTLLSFGIFLYFRTAHDQNSELNRSLTAAVGRIQPAGPPAVDGSP